MTAAPTRNDPAQKSAPADVVPEQIACPDCGLVQRLPVIGARHIVECARCERVLIGRAAGRVDVPLALASCALLLMLPAVMAPLMSVSTFGAMRESWLYSGIHAFSKQGFPELGALVFVSAIALPFAYLSALVWVLGHLRFARENGPAWRGLGPVYRWVGVMRPWMMIEVFLIGAFVAYTRIDTVAAAEVDVGGWCLIAATFALLLALTQLDDRTVWEAVPGNPGERTPPDTLKTQPAAASSSLPPGADPPRMTSPSIASASTRATLACTTCDLLVPTSAEGRPCPRCHAPLHVRKPHAVRRTAALLIAGYLLYIPANLLPVMTLTSFGGAERNTLLSGVLELIHNNLWPLAVIVFVASIVLPLMKLLGLTWMLVAIQLRSDHLLRERTRLFRTIDLIGRWSNIDVFMGAVLVSLLQFGALTSVRAEPGLVAFAAVVVITMLATEMFDSRLMWDAAARRAA